jgi:hypothetical protein
VLAFLLGSNVTAATVSPDGLSWSAPSTLGTSEAFGPGLAFGDGVFLGVLTRVVSSGQLSFVRFSIVSSPDGVTWSGPLGEGGNWDQSLDVPATAAYGQGRLLLARRTSSSSPDVEVWVGQADNAANPTSITFPLPPQGTRPGARSGPHGVSVAFGGSAP